VVYNDEKSTELGE